MSDSKTFLVTGDTGFIGSAVVGELIASKASSAHIVCAWGRPFGMSVVLCNSSNNYGPYHAAYTALDRAESELEAAHALNTILPATLACNAARHDIQIQ